LATLDSYIAELKFFAKHLQENVVNIGVKNERGIINTQNTRHKTRGLDAKGKTIGSYSANTIARKNKKGQPSSFVTLEDTGNWHSDMFVGGTDELFIDNHNSSLTTELMNGGIGKGDEKSNPPYGKDIIGLTDEETVFLTQKIIDPELQKIINKLPQTIDI